MASPEGLLCGKCPAFDRKTVVGTPVGKISVDGKEGKQEVTLGYCRTDMGLRLGILREDLSCRNDLHLARIQRERQATENLEHRSGRVFAQPQPPPVRNS